MRHLVAVLALSLLSTTAAAQNRAVFANVGGGLTLPLSHVGDNYGAGWNVGMGFLFPLSSTVGVQLDFLHARVADRTRSVDSADSPIRAEPISVTASHFMDAGTASIRFTPRQAGRIKAYALAGAGIYYRKVTLSSVGAGLVSVCNPWWFSCSSQPVAVDSVVGRRNSVGVGFSLGAGISFTVNDELTAFIEARFHDILGGPTFVMPDGRTEKATAQYLPLVVGVRF